MAFPLKVKENLKMISSSLLMLQIRKGRCPRSQNISIKRMGDTGLHFQGAIYSISIC